MPYAACSSRDPVVLDQLNDDLPTTHSKHLAPEVISAELLLSKLGIMHLVSVVLLWAVIAVNLF